MPKLFGLVLDFIRESYGSKAPIDIEQVLWALRELEGIARAASDNKKILGYILENGRLGKAIGHNEHYQPLLAHLATMSGVNARLTSDINVRVYDLYAQEPAEPEIENTWGDLLRPLLREAEHVDIFTTNYDVVIEVALDVIGRDPQFGKIDTGRRGAIQRYLDDAVWRHAIEPKSATAPVGLLTKLHGSVDWSRGTNRIYVGDPLFKGDHRKHVILYPGFKGVPREEPFSVFHDYFRTALQRASHVVVVGFAFRDEYINQLFARFLSPDASVVVLNPAEELPGLPVQTERIQHIKALFDQEGAKTALAALRLRSRIRAGA